jgi:hypothetical protein
VKVRIDDNDPCRYIVSSESEAGAEYIVDLCKYEIGLDSEGNMDFNGACVCTRRNEEWLEHGCKSFIFNCEPELKKPSNMGKVFRCKHVRAAREYAFRLLLPYIAKNRPNLPDEQQV